MATITVRRIDPVTFEPSYGNGQADFIADLDAVIQILNTRLRLFQGEWFLNLDDGLPMFKLNPSISQILGASGNVDSIKTIINLISSRISTSPFVTNISSVVASYQNRRLKYTATVQTQFGTVVVNNSPGSAATLVAST